MSTRAKDWYETEEELNSILDAAEVNAVTDAEMTFVDEITTKIRQYGSQAFLSERQNDWLRRIAKVD